MLPDLRGEQVLDALKSDAELRSVPVAIVTSGLISRDQRARLEQRAQVVMQKSDLNFESARAILDASAVAGT